MRWCGARALCALLVSLALSSAGAPQRPHIIFFLADDLGWNDVGFHGSGALATPNVDALAYAGRALQRYYVPPICSPSRAALFTGRYPIHTGMQHGVIYGAEPRGLPLSEKLLPEHLRELGYRTHLVGKWHLGSHRKEYLPLHRGFESHTGFWTGRIDMYDHSNMERGSWGYDFRRGFEVAHDLFGKYATDVYTEEAIKVVARHNASQPLFLMVAHSAVHSGSPGEPLRAPDHLVDRFAHIADYQRRKFAAVLSKMDESIGLVVEALETKGLLENSIIVFSTDNGGPAAGFNDNAASNYPLRGVKNTLWEGGVRGAGAVWAPALRAGPAAPAPALHIVDWLPTLLRAAGAPLPSDVNLDGIDQWEVLTNGAASNRTSIVHNIDDIWGSAAITVNHWKLLVGTNYNGSWDQWYGPSEREGEYDIDAVLRQPVGRAMSRLGAMPDREQCLRIREQLILKCDDNSPVTPCNPLAAPCLFNIQEDPCEKNNLADKEPVILERLLTELARVNATAVPPNNRPLEPRGDPKYWGRVYTNFDDYLKFENQKLHEEQRRTTSY